MKAIIRLFSLCLILVCQWNIRAQTYDTNNVVVQTFVGSGFYGWVDGQGLLTMFYNPSSIVADSSGNLFVLDNSNYRIRKVTPDGTVTTFIGGGNASLPGYGTNVSLNYYSLGPMIIDHSNVLWIVNGSSLLRVSTEGATEGFIWSVPLNNVSSLSGICVDSKNNLYLSSSDNRIYRYETNGALEVFVGSGNSGAVDGNGIFTSFDSPRALVADAADNIYVWDSGNHLIRKINQNRDVTTFAGSLDNSSNADGVGTNASLVSIDTMCTDSSGNIILTCGSSYYYYGSASTCVRRISASTNVTTIAGSFTVSGYTNGPGDLARFSGARGVCVSQGTIYVADSDNQRIRSITFNPPTEPVLPADLQLSTYPGLNISGTVGRTYRIESSSDMNTWKTEATLVLPSSPYLWIDQNAVNGTKYYRAFLLP